MDFLPSPLDRPPVEGIAPEDEGKGASRKPDPKEPFAALAFKTVAESTGDLVYIRVYSGVLKPGETYMNTTNGETERIARFYRMMGDKRQELEKAGPGDIVAAIGLKQTYHGQHAVRPEQRRSRWSRSSSRSRSSRASLSTARRRSTRQSRRGARPLGARRPDDQDAHRRGDEGHDPRGHGRIAPGSVAREAEAGAEHPQGDPAVSLGKPRVAYRQTFAEADELRNKLHQADRRPRQVRRHQHARTSR